MKPKPNLTSEVLALSEKDWQQLVAQRKAIRQFKGQREVADLKGVDENDGFVLDVLATTLSHLGVETASPQMLRKHPNYSAFKAKCGPLIKYLSSVETRVEQRLLLQIGIELLYRDTTDMGIPVSGRTLMNYIHRIPATMNKHFPGYAACGMLGFIIKSRQGEHS